MTAQTVGPMMHKKTALVVVVAASVLLSLAMLITPRPAQASTTFTVNALSDNEDASNGDNRCDINTVLSGDQCTLRAAIQQANRTPGADTINFDIPDSFGTGVKTIHVGDITGTELEPITESVTIDGYTQPGSSPNTLARGTNAKLMVQLEGSAAPNRGLTISASGVVVKGLVVNHFNGNIYVDDAAANARIEGNFIGTDPSGTKARGIPNSDGVFISDSSGSTDHFVGGPDPAQRNLISGNSVCGVNVSGSGISAVWGNLIGTQRDGKSPLGNGNSGVCLAFSNHNVVGGESSYANTIAFNGHDGVSVFGSAMGYGIGNYILSNSIFSNAGLGIDLVGPGEDFSTDVPTKNDPGDTDSGANDLQNKPVLVSAKKSASGKTVVKGTLNSGSNTYFRLQFFSNPRGTNEGKTPLFDRNVTTNGSGNVSFSFATKKKVRLGQNITATATSTDTSEFSAPRKVVAS